MTDRIRIGVGGTGAIESAVHRYYHRWEDELGLDMMSLHLAGLGRTDVAVEMLHQRIVAKYGEEAQIDLVAHSQATMVALCYSMRYPHQVAGGKIALLSALNRGTGLCRSWMPFVPAARFMAPHSRFSQTLSQDLIARRKALLPLPEYVSIWTPFDMLIWPPTSSYLEGADNFILAPRALWPVFNRIFSRKIRAESQYVDCLTDHIREVSTDVVVSLLARVLEAPVRTKSHVAAA